MLLIERAAPAAPVAANRSQSERPGFVGDHFRWEASGEIWVIDTIRVGDRSPEKLGDAFESLTLFGGIEAVPPPPGAPPRSRMRLPQLDDDKKRSLPAWLASRRTGGYHWFER